MATASQHPQAGPKPMEGFKDWHGWSRGGSAALHVGYLPGRKSAVLYEESGTVIRPLAYFLSEADARRALFLLDELMGAR